MLGAGRMEGAMSLRVLLALDLVAGLAVVAFLVVHG
jgi:hypothetical protein